MGTEKENNAYSRLSPKRQRFVDEYVVDFNGTQAAIRAGYSPKTATSQAERLLRNVDVKEAVAERRKSIKRRSVNHKHWLLRKTKLIINKCTSEEKWNPVGANGATRNMVDILGLRLEKRELSGPNGGPVEVQHDLSALTKEELVQLLTLLEKAGKK